MQNISDQLVQSAVEIQNLTKLYGEFRAVDDISFTIRKNEIFGLLGPNGAGKTTIFNVITGVYKPTSGEINFNGQSLVGKKRHQVTKMGIARTFQNIRLFGDMTALENVITATDVHKKTGLLRALIGTPLNRREEKESKARAHELLALMGIDHRADQLAKNLPYGDQRRLEIARALATNPQLVLLDEPFASQDLQSIARIIEMMQAKKNRGITFVVVAHAHRADLIWADAVIDITN